MKGGFMAGINSLLGSSWFTKIQNLITGFFAIIPQFIYFIYTSCASFLDFLQYLIRKLAGLDVYYVNGEATSGDIVVSFVKGILGIEKSETYSAMSTVFWSLVIFGCILLILSTIFSIIKAHYNYDSKKSHPITIVLNSLKTLSLMAIVPIVAIFGLYLSNILLKTLDEITSSSSYIEGVFSDYQVTIETDKGEEKETIKILNEAFKPGIVNTKGDEDDENQSNAQKVYGSYDFFGTVAYTNSQTFSGVLFKTVAYNCNRVRSGEYTTPTSREFEKWDNFGIFFSNKDASLATEDVANQIDFAFSNALTLQDDYVQTIGIYEAIKNKDLDWKRIWNKQMLYPELVHQIEIIAKEAHEFLLDSGGAIVREYAKKSATWKKFRDDYSVGLTKEFVDSLISKELLKADEKAAKRARKFNSDIELEVEFYTRGYDYWMKFYNDMEREQILSGGDRDFIKMLASLIIKRSLPGKAQIKRLLKIINKAEDVGYIMP